MAEEFGFKDPHKKQSLTIRTVPAGKLEVIEHQRKARPAHVKNLTASMERIGFVVPLVAIERDGSYLIIDGQHRFQAAKDLGIKQFPVIVVPGELAQRMMNFNVEKDLNIREKSAISLSIYRGFMDENPNLKEDDSEIADSIENAHYVTLGLAYQKAARLAGSSFESMLKRCDGFLNQAISEAYGVREQRAALVIEAHELVKAISAKIKEMGAWHSFVTQQILSYANPIKRKRGAIDFDDAFSGLIKRLQKLEETPEKALRASV